MPAAPDCTMGKGKAGNIAAGPADEHDAATAVPTVDGAAAQDLTQQPRIQHLQQQVQTLQARIDGMAAAHAGENLRMAAEREACVRGLYHDLSNQAAAIHGFVHLLGDPLLLRDARQHLLDNAWKFTAHTQDARIEVGCSRDASGGVTYHVRDNGIGFPAREMTKAFLPFKRMSTAEGFPGTGIGLATVRRVVEKHHGRVWAEIHPGGGVCFYFTPGGELA